VPVALQHYVGMDMSSVGRWEQANQGNEKVKTNATQQPNLYKKLFFLSALSFGQSPGCVLYSNEAGRLVERLWYGGGCSYAVSTSMSCMYISVTTWHHNSRWGCCCETTAHGKVHALPSLHTKSIERIYLLTPRSKRSGVEQSFRSLTRITFTLLLRPNPHSS